MKTRRLRECQSPDCALRYPEISPDGPGSCPRCTGKTKCYEFEALPKHVCSDTQNQPHPLVVVLDNIRSLHNLGSIFRTAEGAGVQRLYLCGITATPDNEKLSKTSLGAETRLPWTYFSNALTCVARLKQEGYRLWALESEPSAVSLFDARLDLPPGPLALVVGNENIGVDPQVMEACDQVVDLPMHGVKDSLNVSVAFGAAIYRLAFGRFRQQS